MDGDGDNDYNFLVHIDKNERWINIPKLRVRKILSIGGVYPAPTLASQPVLGLPSLIPDTCNPWPDSKIFTVRSLRRTVVWA